MAIPQPFIAAVGQPTAAAFMQSFTVWRFAGLNRQLWWDKVATLRAIAPMSIRRNETVAQEQTRAAFFATLYSKCSHLYGGTGTDADPLALVRHPWSLNVDEFTNCYEAICQRKVPGTDIVPDDRSKWSATTSSDRCAASNRRDGDYCRSARVYRDGNYRNRNDHGRWSRGSIYGAVCKPRGQADTPKLFGLPGGVRKGGWVQEKGGQHILRLAYSRHEWTVVGLLLAMVVVTLGGALLSTGDRRIGAALELTAIAIGAGSQFLRQPWGSRVYAAIIGILALFYAWWYLTSLYMI